MTDSITCFFNLSSLFAVKGIYDQRRWEIRILELHPSLKKKNRPKRSIDCRPKTRKKGK